MNKYFNRHLLWAYIEEYASMLGIHLPNGTNGLRFDWRAAITAMGASVLVIGLYRLLLRLAKRFSWKSNWSWKRVRRGVPQVPFYVRLEKLLSRLGYERRLEQTPREYAEHCALLTDDTSREAIRCVVNAYYRVRFGQAELATPELQSVEQSLTQLEQRLISA